MVKCVKSALNQPKKDFVKDARKFTKGSLATGDIMKCAMCGKELRPDDDQIYYYGKNYCMKCFRKIRK